MVTTLALAALCLLAFEWTVLTTLHVAADRPHALAMRFERLSRAWPITPAKPLAWLPLVLVGCLL